MQKIHFIAIGGSAMHNLAIALKNKGYQISGSDDTIFDPSKSRLEKHKLLPKKFGWFPEKITQDIDVIILGMHAQTDNPELKKAQEIGVPIFSYPEYLYEQSKNKNRVVIAGSHGKTTITSMILHVLNKMNISTDYMVGSQLKGFENMVSLNNENDNIILEGDEYLSSPIDTRPKFLWYKPHTTVISGIAWDHMNKFPDKQDYIKQFDKYIDSIVPGGTLIYNKEDKVLAEMALENKNNINKIAYKTPDYEIVDGIFHILTDTKKIPLNIFGKHNMQNLEAARNICKTLNISDADFFDAIQSFQGADMRLENILESDDRVIIKDFAHAPSKVQASVNAVKEKYPHRKVIAILELHTYSSLNKNFLPEYKNTLNKADEAVVFYSPKAIAIKRMEPIAPELIVKEFNRPDLKVFTEPESLHQYLYDYDLKNKVLLLMSSGSYGRLDFKKLKTINNE